LGHKKEVGTIENNKKLKRRRKSLTQAKIEKSTIWRTRPNDRKYKKYQFPFLS